MDPSHILRELVLPPGGLVILLGVGLALWNRRPRVARGLLVGATFALYLLSTSMVALPLQQWAQKEPVFDGETDAQAIVILGGGVYHGREEYDGASILSFSSLQRARYGLYLQRKTGLPVLACGRGSEKPETTEAALVAEFLESEGVQEVWQERESSNTWENALFGVAVLRKHNVDKLLLVTNALHARRARRSFEAQGIEVESAPTVFRRVSELDRGFFWVLPRSLILQESSYALRSLLGELWYELRYY